MLNSRVPGKNFLFVPGPTNLPDRIVRAMAVASEDHRSPTFPDLVKPLFPGLKKYLVEKAMPLSFRHQARAAGKPLSPIRFRQGIRSWLSASVSFLISGLIYVSARVLKLSCKSGTGEQVMILS